MRFPFFRAKPEPETEPLRPAPKRAERARNTAPETGPAEVNALRTRARQRLVGALVLLLVGVVGFPVLFETQPRPLPLDIPIQVGARDGGKVMPVPAPVNRPLPVTSLPADAGIDVVPAPQAASATTASTTASTPASSFAAPTPTAPTTALVTAPVSSAPGVATVAALARIESPRASTVPASSSAASASAPAAAGRFVVQVGAYTDARTLKDTRSKVEKLGLQTYTQVIDGDAGKRTRVRLGPFATRAEAEAAAEKLKRADLPANILAL